MKNVGFVPKYVGMKPYSARRMAKVYAGAFGFFYCWLLSGCETDGVSASATPKTPPPSANVKKVQAWKDAELLASRGSGREALVGGGDSMKPIYGENTMLVVTPIEYRELQPGMTVVYVNRHGRRVAHQLLEKTAAGWRVQGLNNEQADSELVTAQNLVGVVYVSLATEELGE